MENKEENTLFGDLDQFTIWKKEWKGMPEFIQEDLEPVKQIIVNFEKYEDYKVFIKLINQNLTSETKSIWFPEVKIEKVINKKYINNEN
jgi:hypothetical protein